jgi:prefoldin subunit 5
VRKKDFIFINVLFLFIFIIGAGFNSCQSTGTVIDSAILDHQRQIDELEGRNTDLTARLDKYDSIVGSSVEKLEDIGRRAAEMGDEIDNIIYLFGLYQSEVQRLVTDYNSLQNQTGGTQ